MGQKLTEQHGGALDFLMGSKILVIASTGGHLSQAVKWANRLQVSSESLFITFDSAQSRSLLADRRHRFVEYIPPRGWREILRVVPQIWRHARKERFDYALSTGAGIALAALPALVLSGKTLNYIESVSRFESPSTTGRIVSILPRVRLFAQHSNFGSQLWTRVPSLLGQYRVQVSDSTARGPLKVLVMLGTIKPYRFDRLVDEVLASLEEGDEVVWQLGVTSRKNLPGRSFDSMPRQVLEREIELADVVVTHGGVGNLIEVLDHAKFPVVMARLPTNAEHVDEHQLQIVNHLDGMGLVRNISNGLTRADLLFARARSVEGGDVL
ncbi:MAG: glycosyltransferase [Rhodoglobus sp.]